ncbi:MAG TPA: hypothetical protein VFA69_01865 [Candidatus Nitrosotalea sp.]|nr:hypothetical protein [Candidatus Nitrosotalea sp.]
MTKICPICNSELRLIGVKSGTGYKIELKCENCHIDKPNVGIRQIHDSDAEIEIIYNEPRKIKTRIFEREQQEQSEPVKRTLIQKITSIFNDKNEDDAPKFIPVREKLVDTIIYQNTLHLRMNIQKSEKRFAKLISGGNFDFYDDLPAGYQLSIKAKIGDESLMLLIMPALRKIRSFHILQGNYSLFCFFGKQHPTEYEGKEIVKYACEEIKIVLNPIANVEIIIHHND